MTDETVATYEQGGKTYEIDHLGRGEFNVWVDGNCVAEFTMPESALKPKLRAAELPITNEDVIRLAKEAVAINEAHEAVDG